MMMFSQLSPLAIGRVQRLLCPLFVPCSAGGGINFEQVRWRKRNASKPLSKHERAERKRKREERLAERKKHSFMQRIQIARMKSALSPSQQHPGRYDAEAEKDLPAEPTANVFFTDWCRTQFYTVGEALRMHRIAQCPAVFNNPSAFVRLRVELNMSTEKTTKMLPNSDELVRVPFPFDHKQKRAILAFAPTKQLQEGAVEAGAELAIGKEMVKKIVKGEFRTEDFDFCVAHSELEKALVPLKSTLRSRYPTRDNGALGDDLPSLIASFIAGIKLSIRGDPVYPIWGLSDVVVGKLNMPDEHLESNIEEIVRSLCRHRNPALGPFINRANLMVIPGNEFYALKVDQWCPQPTEEQIEKLLSRKRKKKTKPTPTEEDEDEEEDPLISLM